MPAEVDRVSVERSTGVWIPTVVESAVNACRWARWTRLGVGVVEEMGAVMSVEATRTGRVCVKQERGEGESGKCESAVNACRWARLDTFGRGRGWERLR
jgi:hypothetical protein